MAIMRPMTAEALTGRLPVWAKLRNLRTRIIVLSCCVPAVGAFSAVTDSTVTPAASLQMAEAAVTGSGEHRALFGMPGAAGVGASSVAVGPARTPWTVLAKRHCASSRLPQQFSSRTLAISQCRSNVLCTGVYDHKCSNSGPFYLCKGGPPKLKPSTSSCVLAKPAGGSPVAATECKDHLNPSCKSLLNDYNGMFTCETADMQRLGLQKPFKDYCPDSCGLCAGGSAGKPAGVRSSSLLQSRDEPDRSDLRTW